MASCGPSTSQAEKEYIKNLEEKNELLEQEIRELKGEIGTKKTKETKPTTTSLIGYFTVGSTEKEVLEIMGDPTTYIPFDDGDKQFRYGESVVYFKKGKVNSYNNVEGNLKVKVNP